MFVSKYLRPHKFDALFLAHCRFAKAKAVPTQAANISEDFDTLLKKLSHTPEEPQ